MKWRWHAAAYSANARNKIESPPVSRVLSWTVIPLGLASPQASSNLPESSAGHAIGFLFGLAPGGVYHAVNCCQPRGALLPHRFTLTGARRRLGGLLSAALSVGSRRPGVTWHLALWSPDFPPPVIPAATVWRARSRRYSCAVHHASKTADRSSALLQRQRPLVQLVLRAPRQLRRQPGHLFNRQLCH